MDQADLKAGGRKDAHNFGVQTVDVGGVILLSFEQAVHQLDAATAIDEVGGIGGDAADALAAGRRGDLNLMYK